jgi:hypothetical protein
MNEYGIWNILAVIIAAAAFAATQLTARRNERASFLLEKVSLLTHEMEKKDQTLTDQTKEIARLVKENVLLMRELTGIKNSDK